MVLGEGDGLHDMLTAAFSSSSGFLKTSSRSLRSRVMLKARRWRRVSAASVARSLKMSAVCEDFRLGGFFPGLACWHHCLAYHCLGHDSGDVRCSEQISSFSVKPVYMVKSSVDSRASNSWWGCAVLLT